MGSERELIEGGLTSKKVKERVLTSSNLKRNRPIAVCICVFVVFAAGALRTDTPTLTLACGVVIALTMGLLWRLGEPPVLPMVVGLQLSQIVAPLLYANFLGVPLQSVSLGIGDLEFCDLVFACSDVKPGAGHPMRSVDCEILSPASFAGGSKDLVSRSSICVLYGDNVTCSRFPSAR